MQTKPTCNAPTGRVDGWEPLVRCAARGGCARVRARQKRVAMLIRDSIASPRPESIGNLPVEMGCEGSARGQGYRNRGAIGMVVSALPLQKIDGHTTHVQRTYGTGC